MTMLTETWQTPGALESYGWKFYVTKFEVTAFVPKGWLTQCKAKTNFHFSYKGFCHIQFFYLAKSLPRKVKVGFSFAMASQPFVTNTSDINWEQF